MFFRGGAILFGLKGHLRLILMGVGSACSVSPLVVALFVVVVVAVVAVVVVAVVVVVFAVVAAVWVIDVIAACQRSA